MLPTPPADSPGDRAAQREEQQRFRACTLTFGAIGGWMLTSLTDPVTAIEVLAALIALVPVPARGSVIDKAP